MVEARAINFRLTPEEFAVLAAVAYLHGTTPTDAAREQVRRLIDESSSDPEVQAAMQLQAVVQARKSGRLTSLPRRGERR